MSNKESQMLANAGKKIEICANIGIVLVTLLGAYALIQKYFVHPREPQNQNLIQNKPATPSRGPSVGTKISIPGVELNQNGKTLLLVISTKCRFCKESAGFYQKIVQEAQSIKDL